MGGLLQGCSPPRPLGLLAVPAHPLTAVVPITVLLYNGPLFYNFPAHSELVMGHFFKTQPKISRPNPQKSTPDPTQPIIDTWYGIGYTENFIQQLLHVTDKFTVNDSYYSAAVLVSRQ